MYFYFTSTSKEHFTQVTVRVHPVVSRDSYFLINPFPQPACVSRGVVLSSVEDQGDEVAVLNGGKEEHKTSSAKVQHNNNITFFICVRYTLNTCVSLSLSVYPRTQPQGS